MSFLRPAFVALTTRCYDEMSQAEVDGGKLVFDEALGGCGKRKLPMLPNVTDQQALHQGCLEMWATTVVCRGGDAGDADAAEGQGGCSDLCLVQDPVVVYRRQSRLCGRDVLVERIVSVSGKPIV